MNVEAIEAALERVLASRTFCRAGRLRRFLEYVVTEELAGTGDRLKEYAVGVEVFDRGADFDPRIDTIVRVEAIKLRQRLNAFYASEGTTEPVRISLPKGSYRPAFGICEERATAILDDPEAICWMSRALIMQFRPESYVRLLILLQSAVARWPNDARLHAALAEAAAGATCSDIGFLAPDVGIPLMQHSARRALMLDPDNAQAHMFAGLADLRRPDKTSAIAAARRALDLAPQDSCLHHWSAAILLAAGKYHEALLHARQAVRLQPTILFHRTITAMVLFASGRIDEGAGHFSDVLAFDPLNYEANLWLGRALATAERFDEARAFAGRAYALSNSAKALAWLGYVEARSGRTDAAERIEVKLKSRTDYAHPMDLAAINVALGRHEKAAGLLANAIDEGDPQIAWLQIDRRLAPLRGRVAVM